MSLCMWFSHYLLFFQVPTLLPILPLDINLSTTSSGNPFLDDTYLHMHYTYNYFLLPLGSHNAL